MAQPKPFSRPTNIQSLLFSKDVFTRGNAIEWAKEHGFKYGDRDEHGHNIRLRQIDPEDITRGTFRTITLTDGIQAVVAVPKRGVTVRKPKRPAKNLAKNPKDNRGRSKRNPSFSDYAANYATKVAVSAGDAVAKGAKKAGKVAAKKALEVLAASQGYKLVKANPGRKNPCPCGGHAGKCKCNPKKTLPQFVLKLTSPVSIHGEIYPVGTLVRMSSKAGTAYVNTNWMCQFLLVRGVKEQILKNSVASDVSYAEFDDLMAEINRRIQAENASKAAKRNPSKLKRGSR